MSDGGGDAAGLSYTFVRDGHSFVPPLRTKAQGVPLSRGDVIRVASPGGGGYGDPHEREPERVLRDVRRRAVSVDAARDEYGVVVEDGPDGYRVDRVATRRLREDRS